MPRQAAHRQGRETGVGGRTAGARFVAFGLAARGISWIVAEAVPTTQGTRFRVRESTTTGPEFPAGVYDGAAGVAMVLADWVRATRDEAAKCTLRTVADGLAASGSPRITDASLYFGEAGRIAALLRAAAALREPALADAALDLAPGLQQAEWELPDLLYGPAGTGIVALQLHRATGDARWLRAARRAVGALEAMAARLPDGIAWRLRTNDGHAGLERAAGTAEGILDTGLAHGVGGVLLFLEQAGAVIGGSRLARLRDGAWRWLGATAVHRGKVVAWPKALGDGQLRHHWCHGTAGLVQVLAIGARDGRRAGWRPAWSAPAMLAEKAGRHAWEAIRATLAHGPGESACHCHGLAGTLDALCAVRELGLRWVRDPVARLVRHLAQAAGPGAGPAAFGLTDAGLETGVAGVVRALMLAARLPAPAPYVVEAVPDARTFRAMRRRAGVTVRAHAWAVPARRGPVVAPPAALPAVAVPLRGRRDLAFHGTAGHPRLTRAAQRLLADARLRPLHESWDALMAGLAALQAEHRAWVRPGALAAERHLALMQHIAGILLYGSPSAAVHAHRRDVALFLVRRHLAAVARCLALVAADRTGPLAGIVAGPLTGLELMDGEAHRGGQRAIALRFADGPELVFKPRDVRVDAFIVGDPASSPLGAASLLNTRLARTLGVRLPTHAIVGAGPSHGYAERLAPAGVPLPGGPRLRFTGALGAGALPALRGLVLGSSREARAFWRAAGALASHLAAFGSGDHHSPNLFLGASRADGAPRLHAIDCEVAFQDGAGVGITQLVPSRSRANPEPPEGPHTHFGLDVRRWELCGLGAPLWALTVDRRGRLVPVEPPGSVQRRPQTPIVIGPDGSSGYSAYIGPVLRGAAEHWLAFRQHLGTLTERLRSALAGARVRVLRKPTIEYLLAVTERELGTGLWTGATAAPLVPEARSFDAAELAQMRLLDVPAFDHALGSSTVEWVVRPPQGRVSLDAPFPPWLARQWWRLPARAARPDALAIAIGELAAFAAPPGPLSITDAMNGVHLLREQAGSPLQVALVMPFGDVQVRLDPDGGVTHWGFPTR